MTRADAIASGLQVRSLAALRGERVLFAGLDFALAPGEALALTGPNGSGKTTLLRLLAGLARPLAGSIAWAGQPLGRGGEGYDGALRYIGHLPGLKPGLTAREALAFEARLLGLPPADLETALGVFALERLANLPVRVLSAGQRRRVALTRLALAPAALWLLDEPTTSLDAASEATLWRLAEAHLAAGGALVAATHAAIPLPGLRRLDLNDFPASRLPPEALDGAAA